MLQTNQLDSQITQMRFTVKAKSMKFEPTNENIVCLQKTISKKKNT